MTTLMTTMYPLVLTFHNIFNQFLLQEDGKKPDYNMMGTNICMGDHKVKQGT